MEAAVPLIFEKNLHVVCKSNPTNVASLQKHNMSLDRTLGLIYIA